MQVACSVKVKDNDDGEQAVAWHMRNFWLGKHGTKAGGAAEPNPSHYLSWGPELCQKGLWLRAAE